MAVREIIHRLKLAGEEFSTEYRKRMAEIRAESALAGEESGEAFASGFKVKAALVGTAVVTAIAGAVHQSVELGREIDTTSKQIGIGVERLQEWRFAASQAGTASSELDDNVAQLTRRIGEANDGNRGAQQSFTDLGVSFKTTGGLARTTEQVFIDVIDKLHSIEDPTKRAALGTKLLGEGYRELEPLVLAGAEGIKAATDELWGMQGVLTQEEIKNLDETNRKFDQMKTILSVRIAGIVADNADAITALGVAATNAAVGIANFLQNYSKLAGIGAGAYVGGRLGGVPGAIIGGLGGYRIGDEIQHGVNDASRDPQVRAQQLADAARSYERLRSQQGSIFHPNVTPEIVEKARLEYEKQAGLARSTLLGALGGGSGSDFTRESGGLPPVVDPKPTRATRTRRTRRTGLSDEERQREREAQAAQRAEEAFAESIRKTIREQEDSARVERVRSELGDEAAAGEEARLSFLRQHPLAIHQTVEALAAALGITKELTEEDRKRLQTIIDQGDAAERGADLDARVKVIEKQNEEAERAAKRQAESAIQDIAALYEDLFIGGTSSIWRNFKREGVRIISEIAAEYTLALISGQSAGDFSTIAGTALSRSPLGSLFGIGARSIGGAANDNGGGGAISTIFSPGGLFGTGGGIVAGDQQSLPAPGSPIPGAAGGLLSTVAAGLGPLALASAANQIIGDIFGFKGGPLGIFTGLFSSTPRGSAIIGPSGGQLGITGFYGNSSSRKDAAAGYGNSLIDSLYQIADALGAEVDPSAGSVSIGIRKGNVRVDPQGRGFTKLSRGVLDFGGDEEAAIRAAISDLISDGVIKGISDASQNILRSGQDLEAAIEKAVLIESVPRLLEQRLNPLGYELDQLTSKYEDLAAALKEGGASADQIAQAQQLFQLEREDVIARYSGGASGTLQGFQASLAYGSSSPLSLRQQLAGAQSALAPYEQQIAAAQAARDEVDRLKASGASAEEIAAAERAAQAAAGLIDQSGFQNAGQTFLGISRNLNASSPGFFSDFDRIRSLTGSAISLIDAGVPVIGEGTDPFAELTANNTGDIANMISEQNDKIDATNEYLAQIAASMASGDWSWIGDPRNFVAVG